MDLRSPRILYASTFGSVFKTGRDQLKHGPCDLRFHD
jgi:hypothetical protein